MSNMPDFIYEFGKSFEFKMEATVETESDHRLWRRGTPIRLTDTPFKLLLVLVEHSGKTLTNKQLEKEVWGGAIAPENLPQQINAIRDALGPGCRGYIEAVRKMGYKFNTRVRMVPRGVGPSSEAPPEIQETPEPSAPLASAVPPVSDSTKAPLTFLARLKHRILKNIDVLFCGAFCGAIAGALAVWLLWPQSKDIDILREEIRFLYDEFLTEGGAIVISNPPVYKYVTEVEQQYIDSKKASPDLRIVSTVGDEYPRIVKSAAQYTGVGEALTLANLRDLFTRLNINERLTIDQSRLFKRSPKHLILLGGWVSNVLSEEVVASKQYADFIKKIPYRLHDGALHEYDLDANSIKQKFRPEYDVAKLKRDNKIHDEMYSAKEWAVITRVSNPYYPNTVVVIAAGVNSQGTQAAGKLISEIEGIRKLQKCLSDKLDNKKPKWFQVVITVPVDPDAQPGTKVTCEKAVELEVDPH